MCLVMGAHIGQMNSVNVNQGNVTGRPHILACLICLMFGVCKKPCKAYCFAATGATMDRTRFNIIVLHKTTTWLKCESFSQCKSFILFLLIL